ncbi:MAG: hypothetical protein R3C56_37540 [Pirellulaceae bacterium]
MDEGGIGRELNQQLRQRGCQVVEVYRDESHVPKTLADRFYQASPTSAETMQQALANAVAVLDGDAPNIIYLWALDAPSARRPSTQHPSVQQLSTESLDQCTALDRAGATQVGTSCRGPGGGTGSAGTFWTSTTSDHLLCHRRCAVERRSAELTEVAQAPLIGFGRVVISELGSLRGKLVDLPSQISARDIDCLRARTSCRVGRVRIARPIRR